jgi:Ca-activated chloride channel family protein
MLASFSFAHPWVLLGLAVPILLVWWEIARRGHEVALPLDHGKQRRGAPWRVLVTWASLAPALLAAVAAVILAGPQLQGSPERVRRLTNIEICLDVSGSMTAEFEGGSRYDAAMAAIQDFTKKRAGDAFGLTIFGNEVLRWVPLTKDLSAIQNSTPFLRPEVLPPHFGGTEIGKGLLFCKGTLEKQKEGDRMIILLSDGVSADLNGDRPHEIGNELAEAGITLHSIFVGDEATQQMIDVTAPTGGEVFGASDGDALRRVFAQIDKMQPARFEPKGTHQVDAFEIPAWIGAGLLAFHLLCLFGLRWTPW